MRYHLVTFGCQMNEADSEVMAGLLDGMGYERTDDMRRADVVLLNTCCVRETAENKVWGLLGALKAVKARRPDMVIGVSGCMPQQAGMAEEICRRFPHVDLVFGTHNRHELPRMIEEVRAGRRPLHEVWEKAEVIPEGLPVRRESGLRAWVPIIFGCNNFCTYCVVPYVRGRERSRRPEDIVAEITGLVARGYREVTLLGQNVNSYGKDLPDGVDFADLLMRLDHVEDLWRIRYTTSHPRDFSDKLIDTIARGEKVCEHFHLPAQAGSNRILKAMHRGYTREYYLGLVERIRRAVPGASITTDLMVGFPGETEEDFADTLDLVRRVRYDQAFTFVYNPRSGTPAAGLPGQVPREVKSRRIQELIALQKGISLELNRALVGRVVEILVEGASETNPGLLAGRARTNKTVVFHGPGELVGRLVPVTVRAAHLTHLEGQVTENSET
ncbi:MAG: tRNA (N6-isopentenyl adenosine(37)-C2)-methylthiotransferase MiaB [Bacillota bacterium]|nr:tRNA (N6-isopentenyl adenosine(37)-C2)-methylthiotransferase MiaB [Bacillota bacterium]